MTERARRAVARDVGEVLPCDLVAIVYEYYGPTCLDKERVIAAIMAALPTEVYSTVLEVECRRCPYVQKVEYSGIGGLVMNLDAVHDASVTIEGEGEFVIAIRGKLTSLTGEWTTRLVLYEDDCTYWVCRIDNDRVTYCVGEVQFSRERGADREWLDVEGIASVQS